MNMQASTPRRLMTGLQNDGSAPPATSGIIGQPDRRMARNTDSQATGTGTCAHPGCALPIAWTGRRWSHRTPAGFIPSCAEAGRAADSQPVTSPDANPYAATDPAMASAWEAVRPAAPHTDAALVTAMLDLDIAAQYAVIWDAAGV